MGFYDSVSFVDYSRQQPLLREGEMVGNTEKFPILRVTEKSRDSTVDEVVTEFPLSITLDNREVVTLLCSPTNLKYLAVGFLFSEGLIKSKDNIKEIMVDDERGMVRVETKGVVSQPSAQRLITSGGGRAPFYRLWGQAKVKSNIEISAQEVLALRDEFVQRSAVFKATGGVHSAALCDTKRILVFSEDIGRHNAIDKIFGECLLKDILTAGRLVITSGRVSSEIVLKVARRDVPLLISKAAPTNMGVRLASDLGITLIGFVREGRMNLYTNEWRLRGS
jgi:FdhD protein